MNRKKKFIYEGVLLSLVGFAMRGVSLALGAYVSRTVGAEGIGLNALIMNAYAFALTFATAGISLTVTALVASAIGEGDEERGAEVLRGAFLYASVFGTLATLLLSALSGVIGRNIIGDTRAVSSLVILSFSLLPASLTSVITGYFVGKRKVALNAIVQVFGQAARVVLTVTLLGKNSESVERSVFAIAVGVTLTELSVFLVSLLELLCDRFRRENRLRAAREIRSVAKMALPLGLSAYVRSALLTLEHSLIPKRLRLYGQNTAESLSSYGYLHGMALPLLLYPMVPLSSFGSLLLPEFAEAKAGGNYSRMEHTASRALGTALSYSALISVFLFVFSEEIGYLVYSSYDAGKFIAILAPVVPIMYLDHVADNMLKGIGEQVYSMWVNIADAVLSVALVFILIPVFGIAGYAIVIISMEAFNFLLSVMRLRKRIRFSLNILGSFLYPVLGALSCATISKLLFSECGRDAPIYVTLGKIVFAFLSFLALEIIRRTAKNLHKKQKSYRTVSKITISAKPKSIE